MNSRTLAAKAIYYVIEKGMSLDDALDNVLSDDIAQQDKSFIKAMCFGACRHAHRYFAILKGLLRQPLAKTKPNVLALLLIGMQQISEMQTPNFAAIDQTVNASRDLDAGFASGLINAVLKKYAAITEHKLPLWAEQSHPKWLFNLIKTDHPKQYKNIIRNNNQQAPMWLRYNVQQNNTLNPLKEGLPATAVRLDSPINVEADADFLQGKFSVQDLSGQFATPLLDLQKNQSVLDCCAAPGSKFCHILETEPNLKELIGVDISSERCDRIKENLQRLKLNSDQAQVLSTNLKSYCRNHPDKQFDRILLDAPCSATGVIRRHPDIKLLRQEEDIDKLAATQLELLSAVWPLLKPGGKLLYATCSILNQENDAVISAFRKKHTCEVAPISLTIGQATQHGWQILPGDFYADGFFYALLCK